METYTTFVGHERLVTGALEEVVRKTKKRVNAGESRRIALFQDSTGRTVDIDYRGAAEEVLARLVDHPLLKAELAVGSEIAGEEAAEPARRGRGRPKLGVVSREISLLPRHWEWLAAQPRSASATLRALVDAARRESRGQEERRSAEEAAHRFLWEMAGDLPGFEAATRAFYAKDWDELWRSAAQWPPDIREHAQRLVARVDASDRAEG